MTRRARDELPPSSRPLTPEEEVTLRRVRYGQSDQRVLRRNDVAALLDLRLIRAGKDGLELTATGRQRFKALPRAVIQSTEKGSLAQVLAEMTEIGKRSR